MLTPAEFISDIADPCAREAAVLLTAIGDEDTGATAAYLARLVRDAIGAFNQSDEYQIQIDLLGPAGAMVTAVTRESSLANYFADMRAAVNRHVGGDMGAFLTGGAVRVHSLYKLCVDTSVPAANVFPPITTLGTVAVTGSGAGTFTAGTAVDTAKYGGAQVALKVINQSIGAASISATVTGLDTTGATRTWTATITNGTAQDTVVNLAGTGVTAGVSVSAVTFTGGTNGDDFELVTVEDRTL